MSGIIIILIIFVVLVVKTDALYVFVYKPNALVI